MLLNFHLQLLRLTSVLRHFLCIFYAYLFTRTNNPGVLVYNQDSSTLLQQALAKDSGKNPPPLLSKDGKTHCPEMPQKGCQVDFIFGGQYQLLSESISSRQSHLQALHVSHLVWQIIIA